MHFQQTLWIERAFSALLVLCTLALSPMAHAQANGPKDLRPRAPIIKPEQTMLQKFHRTNVISVKFQDDLPIRLRNGDLSDLGTGALDQARNTLNQFADGTWKRITIVDEQKLDQMRQNAQRRLGRAVADLNTSYYFELPPNFDAGQAIDAFNALNVVELASPVPVDEPPPIFLGPALPPDFQPNQGYLDPSPDGVDASFAWNVLKARGAGVKVVDIEFSFNANHLDLPTVDYIGSPPSSQSFADHGTAVLGELVSIENGWGTTGIAPEAKALFASHLTNGGVYGAIVNSTAVLDEGDLILVEAQISGPNGAGMYVPVEWNLNIYNAIVLAVGNGIIVVEAAGNGNQNLDDPIFSTGNNGHWPFLAENDSGAIIVGAGAAPCVFGGSIDRSRLGFSTYGSRVNLQGWGELVWTTGYGSAYSAGGVDLDYASGFNGTSSASPIVAGACILLQSAHKRDHSAAIDPLVLRDVLVQTGAPQQSGINPASQHIGPRPDVRAAALAFGLASQSPAINVPGDYSTIQAAINAAAEGDEIVVADGTYVEQIEFGGKDVVVRSQSGASLTMIDAQNSSGSTISMIGVDRPGMLSGFTITGGVGTNVGGTTRGGGIYIDGGAPRITNCVVQGNSASQGGGVYIGGASAAIFQGCTILANSGTTGGAVYDASTVRVAFDRCQLIDNASSSDGGGLHTSHGDAKFCQCRFSGNDANSRGGAAYVAGSALVTMRGSTVSDSQAMLDGGAVFVSATGNLDAQFTQFVQNQSATGRGGAVHNNSGSILFRNASFESNTASSSGGAISTTSGSSATVQNSYFCDNDPNHISGQISGSGNVFDVTCPSPPSPDIDGDGAVNVSDLLLLLGAWGLCPNPIDCPADLDGDGEVDVDDLVILLDSWT